MPELRAELAAHAASRRSGSGLDRYLRAPGCACVRGAVCLSVCLPVCLPARLSLCVCVCVSAAPVRRERRRRWLRLRRVGPRRVAGGRGDSGLGRARRGRQGGVGRGARKGRGKARREDGIAGRERGGEERRMQMRGGEGKRPGGKRRCRRGKFLPSPLAAPRGVSACPAGAPGVHSPGGGRRGPPGAAGRSGGRAQKAGSVRASPRCPQAGDGSAPASAAAGGAGGLRCPPWGRPLCMGDGQVVGTEGACGGGSARS